MSNSAKGGLGVSVLFCAWLILVGAELRSEENSTESTERKLAMETLAGYRANQLRLNSGVFSGTESESQLDKDYKVTEVTSESSFYSAFDVKNSLYRFERSCTSDHDLGKWNKYIRTADQSLFLGCTGNALEIGKAEYVPRGGFLDLRQFDIHIAGPASAYQYDSQWTLENVLERIDITPEGKYVDFESCHREEDGRIQMVVTSKKDPKAPLQQIQMTIDFDPEKSNCVLEWRTRARKRLPDGTPGGWSDLFLSENQTTWKKQEDVWVPERTVSRTRTAKGWLTKELVFEWKSVNQKIPDEEFTQESLGFDQTKFVIVDMRGDAPKVTRNGVPVRTRQREAKPAP